MNRAYLLAQCICPYFINLSNETSKLKVVDFSDNALGPSDTKLILENIEHLALTDLDLSFNSCGRIVTHLFVDLIKTALLTNDSGLLMNSL